MDLDRGYVYDPTTTDIYEVELEPHLTYLLPWRNLNPFADVPYLISSDGVVKYLGRLADLIAENREWRRANPAAKLAEIDELLGWIGEEKEPPRFEEYFYLSATQFTRVDIDPQTLLPPEWAELEVLVKPKQLLAADVVLGGWANQEQRINGPPEFKIISPALLLREEAFLTVNTFCLINLEPDVVWAKCR